MPAVPIRSLQSRSGFTVRTRQGSKIFNENSPQNTVSFGCDNSSGSNTFLAAPGAGFCWVITSLVVSFNPGPNNTIRVNFSGNLSALVNMPGSPTAPAPPPAVLVSAPTAMAANTSFGNSFAQSGSGGTYSVAGTAYKATVGTVFNPQTGQVIGTPVDSDVAADLG